MSFSAITTTEKSSGKPVSTSVLTKIKDNFDDHESRLGDLEGGITVAYPPIIMRVEGTFFQTRSVIEVAKTTCNFNMTILGAYILVETAGSSGSYQIDLKVSNLGGPYFSIFTTKPAVPFGAGNDSLSSTGAGATNAVLNPLYTSVLAGGIIRLDIESFQVAGTNFLIRIDYERA